jgi:hypothetical protein
MEESEGRSLYSDVFINLSQQRIVMAQDGYVRPRLLGELKYIGSKDAKYVSISGLNIIALTHKFTGKMILTVYGPTDDYPTVYNNVTVVVQRALLQDKYSGYQIISLELN